MSQVAGTSASLLLTDHSYTAYVVAWVPVAGVAVGAMPMVIVASRAADSA